MQAHPARAGGNRVLEIVIYPTGVPVLAHLGFHGRWAGGNRVLEIVIYPTGVPVLAHLGFHCW